MEEFLALLPEPRSDNINIFLFCHAEKLKYRVRLPGGEYLHLSPEVKYWLKKYESPLVSTTRSLCKEADDMDLIDFSAIDYSPVEIITFFYLILNPDDVSIIEHRDFASEIIMLSHLYAPLLTEKLLRYMLENVSSIYITSDIITVQHFWKLILVGEIVNVRPYWMLNYILSALKYFPHSIYEIDTSLDIEKLLSRYAEEKIENFGEYLSEDERSAEIKRERRLCPIEIIQYWKEGNEEKLRHIEHRPDIELLIEKNDAGVALLRIPTVAKQMGLDLTDDECIDWKICLGRIYKSTY